MKQRITVSLMILCLFSAKAAGNCERDEINANKIGDLVQKVKEEMISQFPASGESCAEHAKKLVKDTDMTIVADLVTRSFQDLQKKITKIEDKAKRRGEDSPVNQGLSKTIIEKVLAAYAGSRNYTTFINNATGKNIGELNDAKEWNDLYQSIKTMEKNLKDIKFYAVSTHYSILPGVDCRSEVDIRMGTPKLTFPFIQWAGYINIHVDCPCKENLPARVKKLNYTMQFTTRSHYEGYEEKEKSKSGEKSVKYIRPSYADPGNFRVREYSLTCCGADEEEEKEKGSYMDPGSGEDASTHDIGYFIDAFVDDLIIYDDENGQVSENTSGLFDQFFAAGIGIGYNNSNDEISFCAGGGYSKQVTDCEKSPLYVGGDVGLDITRSGSNSSQWTTTAVMFGPRAEIFTPIISDDLYFKTGLAGGFGVGVQKSDYDKSNFTMGYIDALIGLYLHLGELAFCIEAALFHFEHVKYKDEYDDVKQNNADLNINKKLPIKASLIIPF